VENTIRKLTSVVTSETHDIKKSIDDLTKTVKEQNSSVRNLKEWKAKIEGHESGIRDTNETNQKKKLSKWQITGIISGIVVGLVVSISGINSWIQKAKEKNEKIKKVEMWMDLWDFSPITHGGKPILDTTKFKIGIREVHNDKKISDSVKVE
jgi:SMC interacting uncharacterized protein involved in chromosome segregation